MASHLFNEWKQQLLRDYLASTDDIRIALLMTLLRVTTFGTFVREFSPPNPKKGGWPEIPPSDSASDPYCRNALSSFKNGHIAFTHTWGGENSRIKLHNVVTHSTADF
ncbi:hypothetical protein ETAA8_39350 [Anatilimnocola aggregata]|uniref:Uncharacterized protein n=1 Tax=Anatilimnocola aggregata TaxID=2528021 RepID=A0A517YF28_9BACT|nr:hypothetical protein [Anatilimnocola aggregata]QDU28830.1 hypothetical protein ETAA8_39350 [Anatilimnocola aggregata]